MSFHDFYSSSKNHNLSYQEQPNSYLNEKNCNSQSILFIRLGYEGF